MASPRIHSSDSILQGDDKCETQIARGIWSEAEHERFLEAMKMNPLGPWKVVADHIGTRSIKQVQTHAQKYQQKVARRQRGLRKQKKRVARPEHRVDQAAPGFITTTRKPFQAPPTAEAPASPSTVEELLLQVAAAKPAQQLQHLQWNMLLESIEPLPFTPEPHGQHQSELVESLQLFLTCV